MGNARAAAEAPLGPPRERGGVVDGFREPRARRSRDDDDDEREEERESDGARAVEAGDVAGEAERGEDEEGERDGDGDAGVFGVRRRRDAETRTKRARPRGGGSAGGVGVVAAGDESRAAERASTSLADDGETAAAGAEEEYDEGDAREGERGAPPQKRANSSNDRVDPFASRAPRSSQRRAARRSRQHV